MLLHLKSEMGRIATVYNTEILLADSIATVADPVHRELEHGPYKLTAAQNPIIVQTRLRLIKCPPHTTVSARP